MKNDEGKIKVITIVGIILVIIVILFGIVVYNQIDKKAGMEGENSNTSTTDREEDSNTLQNEEQDKKNPVVNEKDDFSFKFLKLENKNENIIYSPLSIKYALKMLQEGAKNNTYNQIEALVGNLDLPTYKNIEEKLSLANSIFIRDTYSEYVKKQFTNTLQNKYKAEVNIDKFENATNVNKWIEEKTFKIIKNMVRDEVVKDPNLQMLLINALAIDMEWEEDFDFEDTYGGKFTLQDGKEIEATMMKQETSSDDISYYLGDDVTALTMNLEEVEDTNLEFMAIMPNNNLKEYTDKLKLEDINNIDNNLKLASKEKAGVIINIPKFSFEYDLELKKDLIDLGITDVFDSNLADLSGMADLEKTKKNLYVSDALHKANIDFSEEGVKAAAVTAFGIMDTAIAMPTEKPKVVNIDKPFLFLIRDKKTKEIWFTGTVYEPNLWENDKQEYMVRY